MLSKTLFHKFMEKTELNGSLFHYFDFTKTLVKYKFKETE